MTSACVTCGETYGNGVRIGLIGTTTGGLPRKIRWGLETGISKLFVVVLGPSSEKCANSALHIWRHGNRVRLLDSALFANFTLVIRRWPRSRIQDGTGVSQHGHRRQHNVSLRVGANRSLAVRLCGFVPSV